MKLLHIIASPRGQESNTLRLSDAFLDALRSADPSVEVDIVDLYHHDLPAIAGDNIKAKYTLMLGQPIDRRHVESWQQIERAIEHFLSADVYLLSTPMWNLSIPYALKYYVDCIVQPGYLFRYNEIGRAVPMVLGRRMVVLTSRGGDYSPGTHMSGYDFQEPYLRAIFGFVGITDIAFVNAQPMDITPQLREEAVAAAVDEAMAAAHRIAHGAPETIDLTENPLGLKPKPIVSDPVAAAEPPRPAGTTG